MSLSRLNNEFETVSTSKVARHDLASLLKKVTPINNNKSYLSSAVSAKELVYQHGSVLPPSTKWNPKQMQSAKKETDEDE